VLIDVAGNQGEHPMQLEITPTDDGYRLEGELDMATAGDLTELLLAASAGDTPLVLDFSGVSFMDSSGLRALLEGAELPNGSGPIVSRTPHPR
jgi:anti-anti-sigma factor